MSARDRFEKLAQAAEDALKTANEQDAQLARMQKQRDDALRDAEQIKAQRNAESGVRDSLYDAAIREWVARRLRRRGHKQYTRDDVRKLRFGPGDPWHGTDVTPGEEDYAAVHCELRKYSSLGKPTNDWVEHDESIEFLTPVEFVQECLTIYSELAAETKGRTGSK